MALFVKLYLLCVFSTFTIFMNIKFAQSKTTFKFILSRSTRLTKNEYLYHKKSNMIQILFELLNALVTNNKNVHVAAWVYVEHCGCRLNMNGRYSIL